MTTDIYVKVALVGGGVAVGLGAGYILASKKAESKWKAYAEEEIQATRDAYASMRKTHSVKETAEELLAVTPPEETQLHIQRDEIVEESGYSSEAYEEPAFTIDGEEPKELTEEELEGLDPNPPEKPEQRNNVFTNPMPDTVRDPSEPYIITYEEFMEDNSHFDKVTVRYFEEDDTMCDEKESPVPDTDGIVGDDNLKRFDEQEDPNVLYIRNEAMSVDYEILREEGTYVEMVLGSDPEVVKKSMAKKPPTKIRDEG